MSALDIISKVMLWSGIFAMLVAGRKFWKIQKYTPERPGKFESILPRSKTETEDLEDKVFVSLSLMLRGALWLLIGMGLISAGGAIQSVQLDQCRAAAIADEP